MCHIAPTTQVLLQEPNPGIEFEFWLPRERYGPFQEQTHALAWSLRQPQPREVEPQPPETAAAPAPDPPRTPTPTPGEAEVPRVGTSKEVRPVPDCTPHPTPTDPCPPCLDTRGRAHRLLHYCGSDFGERPLFPNPHLAPADLNLAPVLLTSDPELTLP